MLIFSALRENRLLLLWLSAYCGLLPCLKHLQMKSLVKNLATSGCTLESRSFTKQQISHRPNDWGKKKDKTRLTDLTSGPFPISALCHHSLKTVLYFGNHSEESMEKHSFRIQYAHKSLRMEESNKCEDLFSQLGENFFTLLIWALTVK